MNEQTKSLIESKMSNARTLEPIKISDTVHSWLNMLNRVVDVSNIVDYPDPDPETARYQNLFGFMTSEDKLYLDGVKTGIFPRQKFSGIDIGAAEISAVNSVRKAVHMTSDEAAAGSSGGVDVNRDSADVQCIDAMSDLQISITAYPDSAYYAEKLVSVKAEEDVQIEYSGNGFSFVNNAIYPNVVYSAIGTPRKTLLLKGNFIVYRMVFIHSRVLVEIVENTQIIDNYKARSASGAIYGTDSEEVWRASARSLDILSTEISGSATGSKTLWIGTDGTVGTEPSGAGICSIAAETADVQNGGWSGMHISCSRLSEGETVFSGEADVQSGSGTVEFWNEDFTELVRLDYWFNPNMKEFRATALSVVATAGTPYTGRVYDE